MRYYHDMIGYNYRLEGIQGSSAECQPEISAGMDCPQAGDWMAVHKGNYKSGDYPAASSGKYESGLPYV